MITSRFSPLRVGVLLGLLVLICAPAQAAILTFPASIEFSGATPPSGPLPWVTVVFDDQGGSGSVLMSLTATNLTAGEFITSLQLNLDPLLDPTNLVFSLEAASGAFEAPAINLGANAFKADGDGKYDIQFVFATSGGGAPSTDRFEGGESISYTVTGIPSLTAQSFNAPSAPGGGQGSYVMAVHVQGIGEDGSLSGWVAPPPLPEPSMLSLVVLASLALLRRG